MADIYASFQSYHYEKRPNCNWHYIHISNILEHTNAFYFFLQQTYVWMAQWMICSQHMELDNV